MSTNTMEYRGYTALIEYSAEDACLVGHVAGIRDRLGFDGESIAEITRNFHDVLDCYLAHCGEVGKIPDMPEPGTLSLRLPPELHAVVAQQSETNGKSVHQTVIDALTKTYMKEKKETARSAEKRTRRGKRETARRI